MRSMKYVATLLFVLVLAQPVIVAAHAELAISTPANGSVLATAPSTVSAAFTEELKTTGPVITVVDGAGNRVDTGDGKVDLNDINHKTMIATLKTGLGDGTYVIHWKAITADDNGTTEGDITFTVRSGSGAAVVPSTSTAPGSTASLPNTGGTSDENTVLMGLALGLCWTGFALRRRSAAQSSRRGGSSTAVRLSDGT